MTFLLKPMKKKADEAKKIQEKQRLLNRTHEMKLAKDAARTTANKHKTDAAKLDTNKCMN